MRNYQYFTFLTPHFSLFDAVYAVQVGNFNTACGTVFGTDTEILAVGAFCIVDNGDIVDDFNGFFGTDTLTFFTADTAVEAQFSCNSTFVMIAARYNDIFGIRHERDKPVGTSFCTDTAADTINGIDDSHIVFYKNSVMRAGFGTIAQSKTAVGAYAFTAVHEFDGGTAFNALIDIFVLGMCTVTGTVNNSDLFGNFLKFNAEDFTELSGDIVGTGDTQIDRRIGIFAKGFCIAVTAGETAGTAVCPRQTFTDNGKAFIIFDSHDFGSDNEYGTAYHGNDNNGDNSRKDLRQFRHLQRDFR